MDSNNWLMRNLRPAAIRAGLDGVTQQCLRRTVATRMPNHGQPKASQGLLRHASIVTTLDLYTKKVDSDVATASASWRGKLNFDGVLIGLPKNND
jgi:integrase